MGEMKDTTGRDEPLPEVRAQQGPEEVVAHLEEAARRGKLPEFEAGGVGLFSVLAYGTPFDADLIGEVVGDEGAETRRGASGHPSGTRLRFRLRFQRRMPVIFGALLVLTVEPGRYFMDEFLATFVPSLHGHIPTWWWWYPPTIISIPWLWRSWMRKSRRTARASALERIETVREILGARN